MTSTGANGSEREVELLRERVAELQRRLAQFVVGGEVLSAHGVAVSISEREALFVEAERISHMGSWVWNVEANEVTWSAELYRILGLDPDCDVASVEAFFEAVHPEDRDRLRSISASTIDTGVAPRVEHRILRSDGTVRHVLTDGAVLFDESGTLRRLVGTILDVTEARQAQLKLARANALLEEAQALGHMGSFAVDLVHGTFEWSREFCRILGVPPDTTGSNELFFAHVHLEDVARLTEIHQHLLANGGRVEADVRIIQPTGELRHVRLAGFGQRGEDGSVHALHGTMLDLTEQHRLQERLMHAEKMEAIGRLAGGIAHDFNNLLMVVRGNLELLGGGERAELRAIMSAVESAQTLTAGLLAFGRKSHLHRRVLDLNTLVTQTVALLRRLIGEHISLSAELDEELPAVEVDASLVQQALINLVINARDVLGDGGAIVVRTRALLESGARFAQLEVEDDGPGIDEAHRARIFEPFFTTKPAGKGSGLGLAMVHGTVAQHGGSIRVASSYGRGSCFTLRFPAAVARSASSPPKAERATLNRVLRRTVLVVEDEPAVAKVLLELLVHAGYAAMLAQLPSEALALVAQAKSIDVVLCDLMMPEMHGTELAAKLQRLNPSLRILFMSGYSGDSAKLPRGAKLLGKPFSFAELDDALRAVLAEPTAAISSA